MRQKKYCSVVVTNESDYFRALTNLKNDGIIKLEKYKESISRLNGLAFIIGGY